MNRLLYLLIALLFFSATPIFGSSVPKMDKDELKSLLGSEALVIIDVRTGRDWSASEYKITGAVRSEDGVVKTAQNYAKDSTFVLYCA